MANERLILLNEILNLFTPNNSINYIETKIRYIRQIELAKIDKELNVLAKESEKKKGE